MEDQIKQKILMHYFEYATWSNSHMNTDTIQSPIQIVYWKCFWRASKYLLESIWSLFEKWCCVQLEFWFRKLYTWQSSNTREKWKKNDKWFFREKSKREFFLFDTISKNIGKNLIVRKGTLFIKKSPTTNPTTVEVKRNILGKLFRYSIKTENKIDFKEALEYLLSPIILSLCHAIETKEVERRYVSDCQATTLESACNNVKTYIFDLMAEWQMCWNI